TLGLGPVGKADVLAGLRRIGRAEKFRIALLTITSVPSGIVLMAFPIWPLVLRLIDATSNSCLGPIAPGACPRTGYTNAVAPSRISNSGRLIELRLLDRGKPGRRHTRS